jgi:hypothetical protein
MNSILIYFMLTYSRYLLLLFFHFNQFLYIYTMNDVIINVPFFAFFSNKNKCTILTNYSIDIFRIFMLLFVEFYFNTQYILCIINKNKMNNTNYFMSKIGTRVSIFMRSFVSRKYRN